MFKNPLKNRAGFTLIELLVVIAIIGILATITLNVMSGVQANAKASRAEAEMNVISNALEAYKSKYGDYPWIDSSPVDGATLLYQALIGERVPSRTGGTTTFGPKEATAKAEAFIDLTKFSIYSDPETYVGDDIDPVLQGSVVVSYDENSDSHYIGDPWGNPYYYYYKSSATSDWNKIGYVLISRGDKPGLETDYTSWGAVVPADGIINEDSLPEDAVDDIIIGK